MMHGLYVLAFAGVPFAFIGLAIMLVWWLVFADSVRGVPGAPSLGKPGTER